MDYEKAYKEALERMKSWARGEHPECFSEARKAAEFIFPELAESEDERIIKEIQSVIKQLDKDITICGNKYDYSQWIAWFEKQKNPSDKGEISDGYHTFNELYYYRMLYNAAFFNSLPKDWVHKSKKHHDGEECFGGGRFIVMANLPTGQISNHYELKDWDLFQIPEKEVADKWDGHTPQEAADRLYKYLLEKRGEHPYWKPSKDEMDALYGLAYITGKMDDKKDEAVTKLYQDLKREFFNGASFENMFPSNPVDSEINVEKQGEQKETLCDKCREEQPSHSCQNITALGRCALEHQGEQKPIDKGESKFKVGDWVVYETEEWWEVLMVDRVDDGIYHLVDVNGEPSNALFEEEGNMRLWSIGDAKSGDVIYLPNGNNEYYFFIFKGIENAAVTSFANFYQYNDGTSKVEGSTDKLSSVNDVFQPATKEQRYLLFQKMKEAGYKWDTEKKELKIIDWSKHIKYEPNGPSIIEEKSAWSEEDEDALDIAIRIIQNGGDDCAGILDSDKALKWLKSLKDRVQLNPKQYE